MACYDVSPYTCTYDSGGNGSLPGGGNPDYSLLSTWEAASDNDLAGYSGPVILDCYDSQDHADNVTIGGATNASASIYRELRSSSSCATPWAGKAGTGANFVKANGGLLITESYSRIRDVYSENPANASANHRAFGTGSSTGAKIINCVGKCTNAGSGQGNGCVIIGSAMAYNCIAYNCKTDGFNLESSGTNSAINCVALSNGVYGFRGGFYTHIVYNCYAANNGTADFLDNTSYWDAPSGWNASKDTSADLGGKAGDNYKNGLDLITAGKMDSDGLALADDLYASGGAGDNYGRNPYDDLASVIDFYDFLKNDQSGETISKKDIRGTDRPTPDTADVSWNVGASQAIPTVEITASLDAILVSRINTGDCSRALFGGPCVVFKTDDLNPGDCSRALFGGPMVVAYKTESEQQEEPTTLNKIFIDGAERGDLRLWTESSNVSASSSTGLDLTGNYVFDVTNSSSYISKTFSDSYNELYFYFRYRPSETTSNLIIVFYDSSNTIIGSLQRNTASGNIEYRLGTTDTVVASGSDILDVDTTYLIKTYLKPLNTSGTLTVWVDDMDVSDINYSGDTTNNLENIQKFYLGYIDGLYSYAYYDDIIVSKTNITKILRIAGKIITGDGSTTEWNQSVSGSNYENVDEIPPNTNDYNYINEIDKIDLYTLSDISETIESIDAIQIEIDTFYNGTPIPTNIQSIIRYDGINNYSTSSLVPSSLNEPFITIYETDPASGLSISEELFNSIEIGYKSIS